MRTWGLLGMCGGLLAAIVLAGAGCDGWDGTDQGTASGDPGESAAIWWRRRPPTPTPPPPTTTGSGGSTGGSSSGLTTQQVIAAAQTADGQAIPQAAGPNGACPEVVVRLGFWSCPTIGQTCTSTNPVRHCVCSRTDGEGQNPTWICQ